MYFQLHLVSHNTRSADKNSQKQLEKHIPDEWRQLSEMDVIYLINCWYSRAKTTRPRTQDHKVQNLNHNSQLLSNQSIPGQVISSHASNKSSGKYSKPTRAEAVNPYLESTKHEYQNRRNLNPYLLNTEENGDQNPYLDTTEEEGQHQYLALTDEERLNILLSNSVQQSKKRQRKRNLQNYSQYSHGGKE